MPRRHSTISLFSGALGLDLGLEEAGFELRLAVECNQFAVRTIQRNRPEVPVVGQSLDEETSVPGLLDEAGLKRGRVTVVTGGPSCQPFSTAGQRGSVDDPRGEMFTQFLRVVHEAQPRFFVMENVRGVMSAAIRHRPLNERGPGTPPLQPEEELGSAFNMMLRSLRETGYYVTFGLLNAADYGVPQTRQRLVFIGSRDGHPVDLPAAAHSESGSDGLLPWVTLREVLEQVSDPIPEYHRLTARNHRFLSQIPEGGNWRTLPEGLQAEALGGAFKSWGGRSGFLRRLHRDRPSPALTTCPDSRATMVCHPTELRPLSVTEYAAIQQFPDNWEFVGSTTQKYLQIGNAVPIGLGRAIGTEIRRALKCQPKPELCGQVFCPDITLAERALARPRTILNPQRMRKVKTLDAARRWMAGHSESRVELKACLEFSRKRIKSRGYVGPVARGRRLTGAGM